MSCVTSVQTFGRPPVQLSLPASCDDRLPALTLSGQAGAVARPDFSARSKRVAHRKHGVLLAKTGRLNSRSSVKQSPKAAHVAPARRTPVFTVVLCACSVPINRAEQGHERFSLTVLRSQRPPLHAMAAAAADGMQRHIKVPVAASVDHVAMQRTGPRRAAARTFRLHQPVILQPISSGVPNTLSRSAGFSGSAAFTSK